MTSQYIIKKKEAQRGYAADHHLDSVIAAVRAGRLSHACRLLTSHGVCTDEEAAYAFLESVQFQPPEADPAALTAAGEAELQRLAAAELSDEMLAELELALHELLPKLPSGIGTGPSGPRYEHVCAAYSSEHGRVAVVQQILRIAGGKARSGI